MIKRSLDHHHPRVMSIDRAQVVVHLAQRGEVARGVAAATVDDDVQVKVM